MPWWKAIIAQMLVKSIEQVTSKHFRKRKTPVRTTRTPPAVLRKPVR